MSYPIFKQNCADTVAAFRQGLSDEQFIGVLSHYRDYIRVAIGRPSDYAGSLFSHARLVRYSDCKRVYSQSCMNMGDAIIQAYSDSLCNAFGNSGFPFKARNQDRVHSAGFSNPVRLAWMFSALGVHVSDDLLSELDAILWDKDHRGFSSEDSAGICGRIEYSRISRELSDIFRIIGLANAYPFGRRSYVIPGKGFTGLIDPRRFTFLIAAVILGHWQAGTIEKAPVPGSAMWHQLALTTYRLTVDDPDQLAFFEEVFGISERDTDSLKFAVGDFQGPVGTRMDRFWKHSWRTMRDIFKYPILWLLVGSGAVSTLVSIVAHSLAHGHIAH